jgi:hypothetical protein
MTTFFMISTLHYKFLGDQIKENEKCGACGTCGENEKCVQGFGGKKPKGRTTWKT